MQQSAEYRDVYLQQYEEYSQYEMPAAIAVAPHIFRPSTQKEDQEGIDLVVKYRNLAVRTTKYVKELFDKFKNQFTIRSKVPYGDYTELDKILRGTFSDAMIYCWGLNREVKEWILLDMHAVASTIRGMSLEGTLYKKCVERESPNGTKFIVCKLDDFPKETLIASSCERKNEGSN